MPNKDEAACASQRDWVRRPIAALTWRCVPIVVAVTAALLTSSARVVAIVWGTAFDWMGIGCLLNARRCHRLHCYWSAPVLLLGAVAMGLLGFGWMTLGPHGLSNTISGTLTLALLSFLPESIWGTYGQR